jgi:ubiquinone/menaquinone biosynthesis C-methylase UbiE
VRRDRPVSKVPGVPKLDVQPAKAEVRSYWEAEPCGSRTAEAGLGTPDFFAQVSAARDRLEPHIARFADFAGAAGREVLEIGVGLGSDHVRFARGGARLTGVDITESGVELTRTRLALEGLQSRLQVADAESLPFADASFDVVYSWGVLHHTPDCDRAIREALRVLRPGGRACLMLYSRRSWVGAGLWARYALLRGRPRRSVAEVLAHHLESPGTRAFTRRELEQRFTHLDDLRLDRVVTPADRKVAGPIASLTGRWLGFHCVVRGTARGG